MSERHISRPSLKLQGTFASELQLTTLTLPYLLCSPGRVGFQPDLRTPVGIEKDEASTIRTKALPASLIFSNGVLFLHCDHLPLARRYSKVMRRSASFSPNISGKASTM